jgi:phage gp36-like protein
MAYITSEDFEEAFGAQELEDLLRDAADFEKSEAAAASLIDGYIAGRYALPLAAVPAVVKGWALDITRYRLWDEQAPEEVRRRYEDALAQLRDLAAEKLALPADAIGATATGSFIAEGYSATRVFTATTLTDY